MRILRWGIGLVVLLALVVVIGGLLLPREVSVGRSIEINAPASEIFPHLNNLGATAAWSPWLALDPETELTYSGPEAGVGAAQEWNSEHPNVGSGRQEIVTSTEPTHVATALDFGEMGTATAQFDLVEADGSTTVTWGFVSDMGPSLLGPWMGLMMDRWVGGDYERGLQNLKALVEG